MARARSENKQLSLSSDDISEKMLFLERMIGFSVDTLEPEDMKAHIRRASAHCLGLLGYFNGLEEPTSENADRDVVLLVRRFLDKYKDSEIPNREQLKILLNKLSEIVDEKLPLTQQLER